MESTEPALSPNAAHVLDARYLRRDTGGRTIETPAGMFRRVAAHVAAVDSQYGEDPGDSEEAFYDAMARLEFLPNSPALMNAGTAVG